jgi:cytochrome c6
MSRKLLVILTLAILIILPATLAAADGAAIYKAKCAMCHGANGSGMTPMGKSMKLRDLRSPEVQKQTDAEISAVVAHMRSLK